MFLTVCFSYSVIYRTIVRGSHVAFSFASPDIVMLCRLDKIPYGILHFWEIDSDDRIDVIDGTWASTGTCSRQSRAAFLRQPLLELMRERCKVFQLVES